LLDDVIDADWLPDGDSLAVLRLVGLKYRIEFPIGHVVYELNYPTYWIRVSPDGQHVVFLDMQPAASGESRLEFNLMTADRTGRKQVLTSAAKEYFQPSALAWSPDGKEIWYSTFDTEETGILYAVNLRGKRRLLGRLPGGSILRDVSHDGNVLISIGSMRFGILCLAPGETVERDLSWLDGSAPDDLSSDGKRILFTELLAGGGPHYSVYVRGTDGSPAVRLSEGQGGSFSPDGKWVDALRPPLKYFFIPTGAGEERPLVVPGMEELGGIAWLPDGKRYLVYGRYPGKQRRFFVWDPSATTLRPVTPERAFERQIVILPSPDATRFPAQDADGKWYFYPVEGGEPRLIPGLNSSERPVNWSADGRSLYVTPKAPGSSFIVSRLDLTSGRKTLWKEIKPDRPVSSIRSLLMTRDGRSYAYEYERTISDLYLVAGLK
jgi:dipeptidyl aminopeptidase/acylaminoacyl peptidase